MPQVIAASWAADSCRVHARGKGEAGKYRKLRGECLGAGDTDLGPCDRFQYSVSRRAPSALGHVDNREHMLPLLAHVFQCSHGIRGLARPAYQDAQPALRQWRFAIAELAGDISIDLHAGDRLEPAATDHSGIKGTAARADGDARQRGEVEWQRRQRDRTGRRVDDPVQRVADHRRMLVQLLFHEVAEITLADGPTR